MFLFYCIDYFRWISWNYGYNNISAYKDTLCEEGNEDSDGWSWCCRENNYPLQAETRRDCHYHTHNRYVLSTRFMRFIILIRFYQLVSGFPFTWNFQLLFTSLRAFKSPHLIYFHLTNFKFGDPNHIFGIHGPGFNVETVEYKNVSFTVWDVGGQDKVQRTNLSPFKYYDSKLNSFNIRLPAKSTQK